MGESSAHFTSRRTSKGKILWIQTTSPTCNRIGRTSSHCRTRCQAPPREANKGSSGMYREAMWTAVELWASIKYREIRFQSIANLWPTRWYQAVKTMALLLWISSFNHQLNRRPRWAPCRLHTQSTATLPQIIIATIEETSLNTLTPRPAYRVRGQRLVPLPLPISTFRPLTTPLIINACKLSKITWKRSNKMWSAQRKCSASSRAVTLPPSLEIIATLRSTKAASNRLCNAATQMREVPIMKLPLWIMYHNQLLFLQIQTLWSTKAV